MKSRILLLLLGVLLGLAAAQLAPRFWHRVTPAALRGTPTAGEVESKRWDEDRLLLTLVTDSGAVLATFSRKVAEIDLLVDVGDTLELGLRSYRPFVEDPVIDRVIKAQAGAAPEASAAGAAGMPPAEGPPPDEDAEAPPQGGDDPSRSDG